MRPAVSVVIPARNAEATLGRTLEMLERQQLADDFEVIVVDDGSSDRTAEIANRKGIGVQVVRQAETRGPGAARNAGVRAARAPVVAFTDADCFPAPGWLANGLAAIGDADLVQGAVEPDPDTDRRPFDRTLVVRSDNGYYPTANLFVRRDLFDSLGGFEDWIVGRGGDAPFGWRAPQDGRPVAPARPTVGEDTLFGWRARRTGARAIFCPDALVHHAVFEGSARDWIRYCWRWKRHMPALAKRIPELREERFYRRWFLDRRTATFDLAVVSVLLAALSGRRIALLGAIPYARWVYHETEQWGAGDAPEVLFGTVASDAVTLAALLTGSAAWRSPLL